MHDARNAYLKMLVINFDFFVVLKHYTLPQKR
jgi:hypothetical protein